MWPASLPAIRRRTLLRQLHRDLRSRVPDTDEEHRAVGELRRVPVLVRVHLHDRRIEIGGERRHLRLLEVRHRDDDVVGLECAVTGSHDEPIAAPGQAVDPRVGADRQAEALGVGLEVVRHLVLARHGRRRRAGNRMPGSAEKRAGVNSTSESHRVRQASPTRGWASRITNERPRSARCVSHRQAGLSAADHDRVEGLWSSSLWSSSVWSCVDRTKGAAGRTSGEVRKPNRSRRGYFCARGHVRPCW